MIDHYLFLGDERIEVRYMRGDGAFAEEAYSAASEALPRICGYFGVLESFPKVRVILPTSRSEYDRLVRNLLKVPVQVPSHPGRVAQPQRTDMVALSPSAYKEHSIYEYNSGAFRRLMAHELTHMVHEHLSPDMEAIPLWWGEGLAVYLSDQWRFEDDFREPPQYGIKKGKIPRIKELQTDRKLAYQWGWTFVRFLDCTHRRTAIQRVVRGCADGDVFSAIGEESETLETEWMNWLTSGGLTVGMWAGRRNYGLVK